MSHQDVFDFSGMVQDVVEGNREEAGYAEYLSYPFTDQGLNDRFCALHEVPCLSPIKDQVWEPLGSIVCNGRVSIGTKSTPFEKSWQEVLVTQQDHYLTRKLGCLGLDVGKNCGKRSYQ